jgi:flavin-dependent dehydrogenase
LIEASRSGWLYSALLPRDELLVSYFTDYDLLEHGHHDLRPYLAAAPFTAERVGKDQLETPSIHNAPSRLRAKIKGNAWLSVGDSASTFDPVSGQGICKALAQAELAANAITSTLDGKHGPLDDYEQVVRAGFSEYLVQRHDYYQAERRWRNMPFWERRT